MGGLQSPFQTGHAEHDGRHGEVKVLPVKHLAVNTAAGLKTRLYTEHCGLFPIGGD